MMYGVPVIIAINKYFYEKFGWQLVFMLVDSNIGIWKRICHRRLSISMASVQLENKLLKYADSTSKVYTVYPALWTTIVGTWQKVDSKYR